MKISLKIKFQIDETTNHVHVPVFVNAEGPFEFTLDTGAVATTLSTQLTDKLNLQTHIIEDRRLLGLPAKATKIKSFQIGSDTFLNEEVMVIDFQSVLLGCTKPIGGVIGHTTLKHYQMSINYRTQLLGLEKSNDGESLDGVFQWSQFNYINKTHMVGVPVFINGQGPFEFVVDTGAGGTVITPELASKLNLDLKPFDGLCRGMGGEAQGQLTKLDHVSVGGVGVAEHLVAVIDMQAVSPKGQLIQNGILGYPFLKQFEVIIDYPQEKFAFVKHTRHLAEKQQGSHCCE